LADGNWQPNRIKVLAMLLEWCLPLLLKYKASVQKSQPLASKTGLYFDCLNEKSTTSGSF
jgi:hypothetical protein